jgi:hypothetical protein
MRSPIPAPTTLRATPFRVATLSGLIGLAALLAPLAPAAAPVLAWEDRVEGGPERLRDAYQDDDHPGVYIWHNDDGWHLRTTDEDEDGAHNYRGVLTTDGHFQDVDLVRDENVDRVSRDGDDTIRFHLVTYGQIDGFDFNVSGGDHVTSKLYEGDDALSTSHIYLGDDGEHPDDNEFTIDR